MTDDKRLIELERADAAKQALDEAAKMLEGYAANSTYQQAFRLGAKLLRAMNINLLMKR